MGLPAENGVVLLEFPGVQTHIDPRDLQQGVAVDQVNLQSTKQGEMSLRPGYRVVTFEED